MDFGLFVVFFIYGLAFFCMGLALILQTGLTQFSGDARALRPLALFGLIHGSHEWLEMILLVRNWFGMPVSPLVDWLRLGLLIVSFAFLLNYSLHILRGSASRSFWASGGVLYGSLTLYLLASMISSYLHQAAPTHAVVHADALARYLLAVPGALLAGIALVRQSQPARRAGRTMLANSLLAAAVGFCAYGLTQVIVPQVDIFPGSWLNSAAFRSWTGVPIQAIRAALAVLITAGLLYVTNALEAERRQAFLDAQEERVAALQQVSRELEARETLRRELLRHTVLAQEDERARISRELHDETAQFLTALSLDLASIQKFVEQQPQALSILQRLQRLNRQMADGIHRLVHALRPAQLDDLGLPAALQYLASEARRQGLDVDMQIQGQRQRLDHLVETVCFRVAQEALTNVIRHAQAQNAWLTLDYAEGRLSLRVRDDGIGFDARHTAETATPAGWGLAGMRERVEAVGGELHIQSSPGNGTTLFTVLPFTSIKLSKEAVHEDHPAHVGG